MTPQTQITQIYKPIPPLINSAARAVGQIDAETISKIYDRVLTLLSNPKVKAKNTGEVLLYILHPKTKEALLSEGWTLVEIADFEGQIIMDADENLNGYEVLRDAPTALYHALKREGIEDLIFDNRVVPLPDFITNALVCGELQKEFSRKVLLNCEGFIEVRCVDEETGIIDKSIRLDIDGWIIRNGFMMPVYRNGKIIALEVFRHPKDERPFRLKSRFEVEYDS